MHDDDQDALAAEYVLGTLSADERDHAAALIAADPHFAATVRGWERRLGELNVMVESIEPPGDVWDRIKSEIRAAAPSRASTARPAVDKAVQAAPAAPGPPPLPAMPGTPPAVEPAEETSPVAALALSLSPKEGMPEAEPASQLAADRPPPLAQQEAELGSPEKIDRSAEVIVLARRLKRWRRMTAIMAAVAAVLALCVAVWQLVPGRIPPQLWPRGSAMMARNAMPPQPQQDRLIAVLQQEPTAPAFLVTFDTRNRTLIVRRVSASTETGRSYELWLISSRFPAPRSLGIVGNEEFTRSPIPRSYDVEMLEAASYAVSLEPLGGSPSGEPTGPILFTGKAVESLPASTLPMPKT